MISLEKHFKNIDNKIQQIPDKLNFKIGEISNILSVPSHVLRYWEKEFPLVKPSKFINNQRLYFKKDIQTLFLIKALLYEEKFSIEGLRKHLSYYLQEMKSFKKQSSSIKQEIIKQKVQKLLASLSKIRHNILNQQI